MSESPQRNNLGRGLAALFGDQGQDYVPLETQRAAKTVPVEQLHPNPRQPRRLFDEAAIAELAESIKSNGVILPLLVRRHPEREEAFEIVAGERRWRAAQVARLHEVPVVIRELSDGQMLELALVENLQREDLSALEEAEAYRHLSDSFGYTQEDLARGLGKSRSHVANTLRLLNLPQTVKDLLEGGQLTAGHARALLNAADPAAAAERVVARRLNVRQTERLAKYDGGKTAKTPPKPAAAGKDPDTQALERDLAEILGLKVTVDARGEAGAVTIHYRSLEQLDDVINRLSRLRDPAAA
jgi:ParB family chromosome partitioning protein